MLTGIRTGKSPLWRPGHRYEDNIIMDLKKMPESEWIRFKIGVVKETCCKRGIETAVL